MANTDIHVSENENLIVKRKGGGSFVSHRPTFSPDSKVLYIVWGNSIRAYSTQTGDFLQEYEGLSSRCTGVQLIPGTETLATCSEKGEMIFWSRESAVLQEKTEINCRSKVTGFHFLGKRRDFFVVTSDSEKEYQVTSRFTYSGKEGTVLNMMLNKWNDSFAVGGPMGNEYLGAVYKNSLYVMDVRKGKIKRHLVAEERCLMCLTAHHSEQVLATGDNLGCILVWRGFLDVGSPPRTVYHWHTLPVADICFSQAGSSMYSGGGECVMVKWMLDNQEKKFLPRMGATIRFLVVAPDNVFVAVSLSDNSIQLVDSQGRIRKVIQIFSWNANILPGLDHFNGVQKIRFDPRTNCLVLDGQTGYLQFFSCKSNRLLYNLDVVCQNYLTQERDQLIYNTEITHVAFSCKGNWIATVEQRNDPDSHLEARIKFWKFNEKKQNFTLNTSIEYPHGGEIFSLEMKPGTEDVYNLIAVTSGADKKFRIWSLIDTSLTYGKNDKEVSSAELWQLDSTGSYKGLSAGDVGFSSDGSIIGAIFTHSLTLWTSATTELKTSLCYPDYKHEIRKVQFGNGDCSHLVVCVVPGCLIVWNLLSLTVSWTVPIELNFLVADPLSSYIAAFTNVSDIIVFKPSDPKPVLIKQKICDSKILKAVFVPLNESRPDLMIWQQKSQLYFLNEYQELLVLESPDDNFKEGAEGGIQGNTEDGKLLSLTPFGRILTGVAHKTEVEPVSSSNFLSVGKPGINEFQKFLRIPPHTMPPVTFLCYSLLASKIKKKGNEKKEEDDDSQTEDVNGNDEDASDSGMESEGKNEGTEPNSIMESALTESEVKIYRPKIESTPELEEYLMNILQERTDLIRSSL